MAFIVDTPAGVLPNEKYGQHKDKIKAWQKKDTVAKTWDNFKKYFSDAYFELKEYSNVVKINGVSSRRNGEGRTCNGKPTSG